MTLRAVSIAAIAVCLSTIAMPAQEPTEPQPQRGGRGGGRGPQAPAYVSPEVSADKKITFRIFAPQAQAVRLTASDIPQMGSAATLTKADNGLWSTTVGPVGSGAY